MDCKTVIIGLGAWGKALATLCARAQEKTSLVLISQHIHEQTQLPEPLHHAQSITISSAIQGEIEQKTPIILACQSSRIAQVIQQLADANHQGPLLCASKGFTNEEEVLFPHEYYQKTYGNIDNFAYLYGPTFANEVCQEKITHAVLGCVQQQNYTLWQHKLQSSSFRLCGSSDLNGLACASVFKNIIAIISGFMRGCDMGENAQALLITHAISILSEIILACGGQDKTYLSIAGLGDTVLSATSPQSRNFSFGYTLATTTSPASTPTTTEGLRNLNLLKRKIPVTIDALDQLLSVAENCLTRQEQSKHILDAWLQNVNLQRP